MQTGDPAPAVREAERVPRPHRPDPRLERLRTLLRMQLTAAENADWAGLGALSAAVADELAQQRVGRAEDAALAEVAHLQLRLELLLRDRAMHTATQLQGLAAQRTYLRMRQAGTRPS